MMMEDKSKTKKESLNSLLIDQAPSSSWPQMICSFPRELTRAVGHPVGLEPYISDTKINGFRLLIIEAAKNNSLFDHALFPFLLECGGPTSVDQPVRDSNPRQSLMTKQR